MKKQARIISVDSTGKVHAIEAAEVRETRKRLSRLAWLLDSSIPVPGTRFTIGVDALIGLFPIIGDLAGVLISSYIVNEARRLGAPRTLLLRMAMNIGIEGVVGVVPLAGDVFDAAWKANQRNVRLLDAWLARPAKTARASRIYSLSLAIALGALLLMLGLAAFLLLRWLIGLL